MAELLRMPEVAAGASSAVLSQWPTGVGASFSTGDVIAIIETDKAVVDVEAEADGTLAHLIATEGPEVTIGDPIALIAAPGEDVEDVDVALASLGIYVFHTRTLIEELRRDAADPKSSRDFGKDIIPHLVTGAKAVAHRFSASCVRSPEEPAAYWRDVGTVDAYWEANIDLTDVVPQLDLYDREWPLWTYAELTPPAKFVHDEDGRRGQAVSSLISGDCIISGANIHRSLVSTGTRARSFSSLDEAVVLPYCKIGRGARLSRVVIDRGVVIPDGLVVGEDAELDARRFRRTDKGISLITQPMIDALG